MFRAPKIIICGWQDSGKTTLYRKLVKEFSYQKGYSRTSPLVNYTECLLKIKNNYYSLFDTPALMLSPKNKIERALQIQNQELIQKADLICWVIDANQAISQDISWSLVQQLNKYFHSILAPKLLILNKVDLLAEHQLAFFARLGQKNIYNFSARQEIDWGELVKKITSILPIKNDNEKPNEIITKLKITIFGPPNSGKSTLMNYLLKKNRSLVSPVAGTTQEPVKDYWKWRNYQLEVVDTAGINKLAGRETKIIQNVLWKCDLAWVIIDATLPLTKQVAQIIHLAEQQHKPLIIIINKCDLAPDSQKQEIRLQIKTKLKSLRFVPIIGISALHGQGFNSLLKTFTWMLEESKKTFTKRQLFEVTTSLIKQNPPAFYQGKQLKIYFAKHQPGLIHYFILFVNHPRLVHFSYQRYITNYLRKHLELNHLPLELVFKKSV